MPKTNTKSFLLCRERPDQGRSGSKHYESTVASQPRKNWGPVTNTDPQVLKNFDVDAVTECLLNGTYAEGLGAAGCTGSKVCDGRVCPFWVL